MICVFEDDRELELILFPPIERPEAKIDCVSDVSDNLNEGLVHHMPRRILKTQWSSNLLKISSAENVGEEIDKSAEEENVDNERDREPPKKQGRKIKEKSKQDGKKRRKWTKSDIMNSPQAQEIEHLSDHLEGQIKTSFDAFYQFFDDELIEEIVLLTNLYLNQHKGLSSLITAEEIKVFINIMVLSGYHKVPNRKLY